MIRGCLVLTFAWTLSGCASGLLTNQTVETLPEFHRCELAGNAGDGTYTITKTMTLDGKAYKLINDYSGGHFKAEWKKQVGDPGSYVNGDSGYYFNIHWSGDQTPKLSRDTAANIAVYFANPVPKQYKVVIERPDAETPPGWLNMEMQTFFQKSTRADEKYTYIRMRLSDLLAISNGENSVLFKIIDKKEKTHGVAQQSMAIDLSDIESALKQVHAAMTEFELIVDDYKNKCPKFQDERIYITNG